MEKKMICPLTQTRCEMYLSHELERRITYAINISTGKVEKKEQIITKGYFCNNDGKTFVKDLTSCPAIEAVKIPLVKRRITELEWMKRHT